jgi:radical SAM superfamily enzyme YgiQ (UPF0313 family)
MKREIRDIERKRQEKENLVKWAHGFPDYYKVGMLNIGYQMAYFMLNEREDIFCERFFLPEFEAPILTLETQTPISSFDVLTFSIPFELLFTNVIKLLKMGNVEILSKKRERPIIIAGGNAVVTNPEPMRDFIDVFVIGELEVMMNKIANIISKNITKSKEEILEKLSKIEGVYVPLKNFHKEVRFQRAKDIEFYTPFIVSRNTLWPNYAFVEVSRGCSYECKFCMLRGIYRGIRFRSMERILEIGELLSKFTKRIRLVASSEAMHPQITEILAKLKRLGFRVVVGSQRAELVTEEFLKYIDNTSFAIAPETSEKLRIKIGKYIKDEEIFRVIKMVNERRKIKELVLHLMVGLPGETNKDILELVNFIRKCRKILKMDKKLVLSINCFIPKPHTDFQLERQLDYREYEKIVRTIENSLKDLNNIQVKKMDERTLIAQKVLTRGDKTLGKIICSIVEKSDTNEIWRSLLLQRHEKIAPKSYILWKYIVTDEKKI